MWLPTFTRTPQIKVQKLNKKAYYLKLTCEQVRKKETRLPQK